MIRSVALSHALREQIGEEARAAFPRECCGLLEGVREGDAVRVAAIHPTRNLAETNDRFEIDPAEHIRLLRALRGTGRKIVGCYHSHPHGRAEPSPHDREAAAEDEFVWLIAAVRGGGESSLAAFAFWNGGFVPLTLTE